MWRSSLSAIALSALVTLVASPASASQHPIFDAEQEDAIERILRSYILSNPKILLKALQDLEKRRRQADARQSQQRIATNRDELLSDPASPVGGNPEGDVTVVEFFDYNCPYCKSVAPRLAKLLESDGNIRFVYKEWPILGPASEVAARAALAARKQGKYETFHRRLMNLKGGLAVEVILDAAKSVGLDLARLEKDMASAEISEIIGRTRKLADSLGITGTPAFVIGDVLVPGAVKLADLKALVAQARGG